MTKKTRTTFLLLALGLLVLCPFPSQIAQPLQVQFIRSDGKPIDPIQVSEKWESYGLWGSGYIEATTDVSGSVKFSARIAYGSIATRLLARAVTMIAVHSSYGSDVTIEFTLPVPTEVAFGPTFSRLQQLRTSGSYRGSDEKFYFSQNSDKGQRVIMSGDFRSGSETLRIQLK